jgi:hypothetical protein
MKAYFSLLISLEFYRIQNLTRQNCDVWNWILFLSIVMVRFPLIRDFAMAGGVCDVSKKYINHILKGSGNSAIIESSSVTSRNNKFWLQQFSISNFDRQSKKTFTHQIWRESVTKQLHEIKLWTQPKIQWFVWGNYIFKWPYLNCYLTDSRQMWCLNVFFECLSKLGTKNMIQWKYFFYDVITWGLLSWEVAAKSLEACPASHKLTLKNRKGFVKMALQNG